MQKFISKLAIILTMVSPAALAAIPVQAAPAISIGNTTITAPNDDTYSNFTVVDTNHPASGNGQLQTFNYYADNTNTFEFVLVDASNTVQWISPIITPPGTGPQTYTPLTPIPVMAGWNLGVHFDSTGTIPFDLTGSSAWYTANGAGLPTASSTLIYEGSSGRTYSFGAMGKQKKPMHQNDEQGDNEHQNKGNHHENNGHDSQKSENSDNNNEVNQQ